jgi:hypothetical protein
MADIGNVEVTRPLDRVVHASGLIAYYIQQSRTE